MTPDIGGAVTGRRRLEPAQHRGHARDNDAATAFLDSLGDANVDLLVDAQVLGLVIERGLLPRRAACGADRAA